MNTINIADILPCIIKNVELLYSGHHRDLKKISSIERCPLHRVFA